MRSLNESGQWSLWSYVENPTIVFILHSLFVVAIGSLMIGWHSRVSAVIVWLGQLSYAERGIALSYGLDSIAAFLTLYLMLGPCGQCFSMDAWLSARRRQNRGRGRGAEPDGLPLSSAANFAIRCIQIHMCIVYLSAG